MGDRYNILSQERYFSAQNIFSSYDFSLAFFLNRLWQYFVFLDEICEQIFAK